MEFRTKIRNSHEKKSKQLLSYNLMSLENQEKE
jgi:hypothetical protein